MSFIIVIYHHDKRIGPVDRFPSFETREEASAEAARINNAYAGHNKKPEGVSHWRYVVEELPT